MYPAASLPSQTARQVPHRAPGSPASSQVSTVIPTERSERRNLQLLLWVWRGSPRACPERSRRVSLLRPGTKESRASSATKRANLVSLLRLRPRRLNPRQHLRPRRRVVSKPCFDHRSLHHIALLHAVIQIHIRVVRTRAVLQRILHEADAIQPNPREAGRVRTPRLSRRSWQSTPPPSRYPGL